MRLSILSGTCSAAIASLRFTSAILVAVALVASPALAGSRETSRERAARKACLGGDYAKGVSILSDLFIDTKDATYIYNQGRCLEQNGRFADAVYRFQEYLRVSGDSLSIKEKSESEKHIADCQAQLAKQNPPAEPTAPVVTTPIPAVGIPTQPSTAWPPVAIMEQSPQQPTSKGAALRISGLATAGIGIAGVVTGMIFNIKANNIADSYSTRGGYTPDKESNRSTYETLGWVGYGVGSACILTGATLYFLGRSAGAAGMVNVALIPSVSAGTAGAIVKGSF